MSEIIIDATNHIAGRLACYAAKQALTGHKVIIINSEKALVSGRKEEVMANFHHQVVQIGTPIKGPFHSRLPDRLLRRMVRGMLPKRSWAEASRGRQAYDRVMCYIGETEQYKGKGIKIEKALARSRNVFTLAEISKRVGGK